MKRRQALRRAMLASFLITVLAASAAAQPPTPVLTAPVNDFAGVIDPDNSRELERRIRALQSASSDVVVVATVKTYRPDYADIREYAVRMFENAAAGVGEKGKDNGLLIVVAVEDRQIGIEVGYGLEGIITDGFSGDIIRNTIRPAFQTGDYGGGLLAGATRIINRIAETRGVSLDNVPRQPVARPQAPVRFPLGTILFILFVLMLMSRGGRDRRRRRWGGGPWSGWDSGVGPFGGGFGGFGGGFGGYGRGGGGFGGGGGGFGGFGGGRSGGGGASGGW